MDDSIIKPSNSISKMDGVMVPQPIKVKMEALKKAKFSVQPKPFDHHDRKRLGLISPLRTGAASTLTQPRDN